MATIAAAAYPECFRFLVLESAAVVTPGEQMLHQSQAELGQASPLAQMVGELKARLTIALCNYRNFDSATWLAAITQPVYAVWGSEDHTIPFDAARAMLREHAAGDVTTAVIDGQPHDIHPDLPWLHNVAQWIHAIHDPLPTSGSSPKSNEPRIT